MTECRNGDASTRPEAGSIGVQSLAAGGGSWTNLSDVHRKDHFRDLDGERVLSELRVMPIREWSYRSQDQSVRHVGPTAQDFRAAFGLGADPLGIDTVAFTAAVAGITQRITPIVAEG